MSAANPSSAGEQLWYAAFPQAQSDAELVPRSEVLELLKQGMNERLVVLVDLRRTDYEARISSDPHSLPF